MSSSACKNNLQPASILCSCCFFMFIGIPVFIIQPILHPDETEWNIIGIIFFVVVAIPIALFFMLKYALACFPVAEKMQTKNRDLLPQRKILLFLWLLRIFSFHHLATIKR
ncbi:unnamed protein product [Orchesella dallaii]|uniref:Uncharacterized protein n=1 Tax=Orchesella dallaii TaxID=48710 RepID=A0ABP1S7Y6_9HEXA